MLDQGHKLVHQLGLRDIFFQIRESLKSDNGQHRADFTEPISAGDHCMPCAHFSARAQRRPISGRTIERSEMSGRRFDALAAKSRQAPFFLPEGAADFGGHSASFFAREVFGKFRSIHHDAVHAKLFWRMRIGFDLLTKRLGPSFSTPALRV